MQKFTPDICWIYTILFGLWPSKQTESVLVFLYNRGKKKIWVKQKQKSHFFLNRKVHGAFNRSDVSVLLKSIIKFLQLYHTTEKNRSKKAQVLF